MARRSYWLHERSGVVTSCQRHLHVHVHTIAWRQPSPHKVRKIGPRNLLSEASTCTCTHHCVASTIATQNNMNQPGHGTACHITPPRKITINQPGSTSSGLRFGTFHNRREHPCTLPTELTTSPRRTKGQRPRNLLPEASTRTCTHHCAASTIATQSTKNRTS